jgi:hypothetical protein
MISRIKPIFNLKILTFPNPDPDFFNFFKIGRTYLQFKFQLKGTEKDKLLFSKKGSLFLNPLIQKTIIEWHKFILFILIFFIIVK